MLIDMDLPAHNFSAIVELFCWI